MTAVLKRAIFRTLAIDALRQANTLAGQNVFVYAWPTNSRTNPAILVNWGRDTKISNGREVPNFTSTFTLRLELKVQAVNMEEARNQLDVLLSQVEQAILTNYKLNVLLQHFPHFDTIDTTDSDSENFVASAICDIAMETFEIFQPVDPPDLEDISVNVDLINRFDATGTYPHAPFPEAVPSAPRTTGPDGRNEGYVRNDKLNE
jgi:hypothetical protein